MAGSFQGPQLNQLITEFYARSMQVILESRIPTFRPASHHGEGSTPTSVHRAKRPAFNIVLGKFGPIINKMEPWCRGVQEPMVIDILFSKRGKNRGTEQVRQNLVQGPAGIALEASGLEQPILLERWTVEFVQHSSRSSGRKERDTDLQTKKGSICQHLTGTQNSKSRYGSSSDHKKGGTSGRAEVATMHISLENKMAILLRSMYSTTRLLPAQNLFRLLSTTGNVNFKLSYKVSASLSSLSDHTKKDMTPFKFPAVECHDGHLCISVTYQRTIPAPVHEMFSIPPHIITDYVGRAAGLPSKQLPVERVARLHSLPSSAQMLPSFKFYNLQQHQEPNKEMAAREGQSWVPVHHHDVSMGYGGFSFVQDEGFECPFAINDERHDRMERAKSRSVKSDSGGYGRNATEVSEGGPLGPVLALLRPAAPLSRAQQPKKTATDALKELKMYIDFRDFLVK